MDHLKLSLILSDSYSFNKIDMFINITIPFIALTDVQ
jgi:hypothetical protein